MTKDEALKMCLEYIETDAHERKYVRHAIKEALAQPEPKYHRGNRLICLETEEYCVIHISGTDRQWVKFPDSYIGVYTNEQVAELFELLPKEPEPWEKFCDSNCVWTDHHPDCKLAQRKPLTENEIKHLWYEACQTNLELTSQLIVHLVRNIEAAHGIGCETTLVKENT